MAARPLKELRVPVTPQLYTARLPGGAAAVMDTRTRRGQWRQSNAAAAHLWHHLTNDTPLGQILDDLVDHFTRQGADPDTARADLTALTRQLRESGLLDALAAPAPHPPGQQHTARPRQRECRGRAVVTGGYPSQTMSRTGRGVAAHVLSRGAVRSRPGVAGPRRLCPGGRRVPRLRPGRDRVPSPSSRRPSPRQRTELEELRQLVTSLTLVPLLPSSV